MNGDLHGALGRVRADGVVALQPPHYGADGLVLDFGNLDLSLLAPGAPTTRLTGRLEATGTLDSLRPPEGLDHPGAAAGRGARILVRQRRRCGLIADRRPDRCRYALPALARRPPRRRVATSAGAVADSGQLTLTAGAESLEPFDSLLTALAGPADTTDTLSHWLDGSGEAVLTLTGSLDSLRGVLDAAVHDVLWRDVRSPGAALHADWTTRRPHLRGGADLTFDSISVGTVVDAQWRCGNPRAMPIPCPGTAGVDIGEAGRVAAGGRVVADAAGPRAPPRQPARWTSAAHHWELQEPVRALLGDSLIAISPFRLVAEDGSGDLKVAGLVPRAAGGAFQVSVNNLPMHDIYGLLERTAPRSRGRSPPISNINGTADLPDIRGSLSLADASFGDFSAPFLQGILRYEDHRLDANLFLWKTGTPVMAVEAALPLDLALHPVPDTPDRRARSWCGPIRTAPTSACSRPSPHGAPGARLAGGRRRYPGHVGGAPPLRVTWPSSNAAAMTMPALGVRYTGHQRRRDLPGRLGHSRFPAAGQRQGHAAVGGGSNCVGSGIRFSTSPCRPAGSWPWTCAASRRCRLRGAPAAGAGPGAAAHRPGHGRRGQLPLRRPGDQAGGGPRESGRHLPDRSRRSCAARSWGRRS